MENKNTVLITAIGSFSADVAIRNCHKMGMRVIGCDIYPREWIAQSLGVDVFYQVDKAVNEDKYMAQILEISKKEGVNLLLPSTDVEVDVLNEHRDEIKEAGITLCISGYDTIKLCRDKLKFAEFVGDLAIPTKLVKDVPNPQFPVIVKPVNGRSSQGLERIYDQAHYDLVDKNKIVQPMLDGDIITVDVCRHPKSGQIVCVARVELLRTLSGAGTSVRIIHDEKVEKICEELAEKLNIVGCICFEFIKDKKGTYHILECNPRLSGGVAFSCMAIYDFIKAHFECYIFHNIDEKSNIQEMYIARKYDEYIL